MADGDRNRSLEADSWESLESAQCLEMQTGLLVSECLLVPGRSDLVGHREPYVGTEGLSLKSSLTLA